MYQYISMRRLFSVTVFRALHASTPPYLPVGCLSPMQYISSSPVVGEGTGAMNLEHVLHLRFCSRQILRSRCTLSPSLHVRVSRQFQPPPPKELAFETVIFYSISTWHLSAEISHNFTRSEHISGSNQCNTELHSQAELSDHLDCRHSARYSTCPENRLDKASSLQIHPAMYQFGTRSVKTRLLQFCVLGRIIILSEVMNQNIETLQTSGLQFHRHNLRELTLFNSLAKSLSVSAFFKVLKNSSSFAVSGSSSYSRRKFSREAGSMTSL